MKKLYMLQVLIGFIVIPADMMGQCEPADSSGNASQCIQLNRSIAAITYNYSNTIAVGSETGLPGGVTVILNPDGTGITISGTPLEAGIFNASIHLQDILGNPCDTVTVHIAVRRLTLTPDSGPKEQTVCVNSPIQKIVLAIENYRDVIGVPDQRFCGLPNGILGITSYFNEGYVQVTGTPTQSGVFKYFISNEGVCPLLDSGIITVNALPVITLDTSLLNLCGQPSVASVIADSIINVPNAGFEILFKAGDHTKIAEPLPPNQLVSATTEQNLGALLLSFCDNSQYNRFDLANWKYNFPNGVSVESARSRYLDGDARKNIMNVNGPQFSADTSLIEITQQLNDSLHTGAIYQLTADFGWGINSGNIPVSPLLRLYVGNTLIAATDSLTPPLVQGSFVTWRKTYQVNDPNISGPIIIAIGKNSGEGFHVQIDHVTLKKLRSFNYDFLWNNDPSLADTIVRGLPLGLNSVILTDHGKGCSVKEEFINSNPTPIIIRQPFPVSDTLCSGQTATFIVAASGQNLDYQWYKGNELITANTTAATPTLVLSNLQSVNAATYKVEITSRGCSVFSDTASLAIDSLPAIVQHPATGRSSYCIGTAANELVVSATGTRLSYQWFSNIDSSNIGGTFIADSIRPSFVPPTYVAGKLYYYCEVRNDCGVSKSKVSGAITVNEPPSISSQFTPPQAFCYEQPSSAFSVSATGSQPLRYQWFKNTTLDTTGAESVGEGESFFPENQAADTFYYYCVVSNACRPADTSDWSGPVIVRPLPVASISGSDTVCQNSPQPLISFTGSGGSGPYTFVYNINGVGVDSTASVRNDSGFVSVPTDVIDVFRYNLTRVKDGFGCTQQQSGSDSITVISSPVLTGVASLNVCDNAPFVFPVVSSSVQTVLNWTRNAVPGTLSNTPKSDTGTAGSINIRDTIDNNTLLPLMVPYYVTLTTGQGCVSRDSVLVTVNPTPKITALADLTYCNGEIDFDGIPFNSSPSNTLFTWSSNRSVGFGIGPSANITGFIASNPGTAPLIATDTVKIAMADNPQCKGLPDTFTITVNPSAPRPDFTWLDISNNNVCSAAGNINFNVSVPVSGVSYIWETIPANSPGILIQDGNSANTVISFSQTGGDSVKVIAINNTGGCRDSVVQKINVVSIGSITAQKILVKQPGNMLIYPDNSMDPVTGYQWGYDSLITGAPDYSFSAPHPVEGQVYQFFTPDSSKFFVGNQLDTVKYKFWVLLQKNGCYTKVYYNGPYARRPIPVVPPESDAVQLLILPNPNNGSFNINLKGNMYGNVSAVIYNALGQVVLQKKFVKTLPEIKETINRNDWPKGLYYIEVISSDLKKATARFIIQH